MQLPPKLVVFDTNVIRQYLSALLRGDSIRDLSALQVSSPRYTPAICVKTLYEVLGHLKSGRIPSLSDFGYPGGIEVVAGILAQSHSFRGPLEPQFRFRQIEELGDWEQKLEMAKLFVPESDRGKLSEDYAVLAELADFKERLRRFLDLVSTRVEQEFFVIERHHVYGVTPGDVTIALQLERDLAMNCFVPSEDFEILVAALATEAVALVTNDNALLRAGLSIPTHHRTAFVAQERLQEAVESGFAFRIFWPENKARK